LILISQSHSVIAYTETLPGIKCYSTIDSTDETSVLGRVIAPGPQDFCAGKGIVTFQYTAE